MGLSRNRTRALLIVAAIAAGTAAAATPAEATWTTAPMCGDWQVETVAQGLEQLENLETDDNGGFYLSGESKIYHVDAEGQVRTVLDGMAAPGGLQLDGSRLSFLTRQDGKLWQLDTTTDQLSAPADFAGNGLLRLPDGDLLTTWVGTEGGPSKGVSRYQHDSRTVVPNWAAVPRSEGLALSPDHRAVYTDDLFTGQIIRVPVDTPDAWAVVATIPRPGSPASSLRVCRVGGPGRVHCVSAGTATAGRSTSPASTGHCAAWYLRRASNSHRFGNSVLFETVFSDLAILKFTLI
ncbi:SMP-30/gluconolactonase/LRE family protein [Rhodococcus erythropolis]|uniref:SMP-30/gluconolactonase/LRE family protein n=1 Tax=Rhodococcus erythropolis TaxID=1833 RepID=UPI0040415AE1